MRSLIFSWREGIYRFQTQKVGRAMNAGEFDGRSGVEEASCAGWKSYSRYG